MRQDIDAGVCCDAARKCCSEFRVDNGHSRSQRIVGERILLVSLRVRNDCERSDLRTGTGCGRDADQLGLLAEFRELECTLTDIHEFLLDIIKVYFRMLIHEPHDLGCVHCRTAAERDNGIRLKTAHQFKALLNRIETRIRLNLTEHFTIDRTSSCHEDSFDLADISQLVHAAVGDDHDAIHGLHVF